MAHAEVVAEGAFDDVVMSDIEFDISNEELDGVG